MAQKIISVPAGIWYPVAESVDIPCTDWAIPDFTTKMFSDTLHCIEGVISVSEPWIWAGMAQSVYGLAKGWATEGSEFESW
jgi:hypothetical protein